MISVEQVRALEERVEKAIAYIASLKSENAELRRDLESAKAEAAEAAKAASRAASEAASDAAAAAARIAELESAAESYRHDQASIEEGIIHALKKLDAFEDLVLRAESSGLVGHGPTARKDTEKQPQPEQSAMDDRIGAGEASIAPDPEPPAAPAVEAPVAEAPAAEARGIDELSMEELEAATAPAKAPEPRQAAQPRPAPSPAPAAVENELDIF
jgi:FtsZ-binding cell division protein ZapB